MNQLVSKYINKVWNVLYFVIRSLESSETKIDARCRSVIVTNVVRYQKRVPSDDCEIPNYECGYELIIQACYQTMKCLNSFLRTLFCVRI